MIYQKYPDQVFITKYCFVDANLFCLVRKLSEKIFNLLYFFKTNLHLLHLTSIHTYVIHFLSDNMFLNT